MRIGIIGNLEKSATPAAIRRLAELLTTRGVEFTLDARLIGRFPELDCLGPISPVEGLRAESSAVVAFGGDGTMLATGRLLAGSGVPLLGVNLGKLGFLAEFSTDDLEEAIDDLIADRCRIVERRLIEATFPDHPERPSLLALNDIVIDKRDGALLLLLETWVNGDLLGTYNADGLIVATPTGSTAYALAVGGPVVAPSARVTVLAPIAPHMLTARPVVLDDGAVIEIIADAHESRDDQVRVWADGQTDLLIPFGARIRIASHPHTALLVKRTNRTYFDVLRAKLLWGRDPVLDPRRAERDA